MKKRGMALLGFAAFLTLLFAGCAQYERVQDDRPDLVSGQMTVFNEGCCLGLKNLAIYAESGEERKELFTKQGNVLDFKQYIKKLPQDIEDGAKLLVEFEYSFSGGGSASLRMDQFTYGEIREQGVMICFDEVQPMIYFVLENDLIGYAEEKGVFTLYEPQ